MNKKCIKCGVEKPNSSDFFRKSYGEKLRSDCRECERKYNKKYRNENKDKFKVYNKSPKKKEHYEKNKEKINKYCKEWYEKNKEEINRKSRELRRKLNPKEEIPEGMKKCSSCKTTKPATNNYFSINKRTKDGFSYRCKQCRIEAEYWDNLEEVKSKRKKYYNNNKDKVSETNRRYKENNPEWYQNYNKSYYKENQDKIKETVKKNHYRRVKEDVGYRLLQRCRKRLYEAVKGNIKSKRTMELIGCSVEHLMKHLESQFQNGMTWENYGEWHVDHIKPCALYDFSDEKQQKECFNYKNLQPLWAKENLRKSAKYEKVSK